MATIRQLFDQLMTDDAEALAGTHDQVMEYLAAMEAALVADIRERLRDGRPLPSIDAVRGALGAPS